MRFKKYLFISLSLILLGCAGIKPTPVSPPEIKKHITPVSLRAEAKVELRGLLTLSGRAAITAKNPDQFRIEVTGPFNQMIALFVSDGKTLYSYSGDEVRIHDWDDPLLPYSFKSREIVSCLLGAGETTENAQSPEDILISRDGQGRLKSLSRAADGKKAFRVELSDYRDVGGAEIPFNIDIEDGKKRLVIKYSSVVIDTDLDPDSFNIGLLTER
ncbi:MAG: hypothetical protein HY954_01215 [Deltaproteobacteria bacterium]|nr:hypothetical protein [Deltaproteobacteria bacterium]